MHHGMMRGDAAFTLVGLHGPCPCFQPMPGADPSCGWFLPGDELQAHHTLL